jgi:hypothetical protein
MRCYAICRSTFYHCFFKKKTNLGEVTKEVTNRGIMLPTWTLVAVVAAILESASAFVPNAIGYYVCMCLCS